MRIRRGKHYGMARLNISLPAEVYEATKRWRGTRNLSQICAEALSRELGAADSARSGESLRSLLQPKSDLERALGRRYGLADAMTVGVPDEPEELRSLLGRSAAEYLNRWVCDGALLSVAGGRQIWEVVRQLSPRSVDVTITALGVEQNDPELLHVHPNTLITILWLLYSPAAKARLVGAKLRRKSPWTADLPPRQRPTYFVLASCGPFSRASAFARLLGPGAAKAMEDHEIAGDFAYVFFDEGGDLVDLSAVVAASDLPMDTSFLPATTLRQLATRPDTRVVLVAGGAGKLSIIRLALRHRLCNVLITDEMSAEALLEDSQEE
jgi:deoxyribonucleoside regulator